MTFEEYIKMSNLETKHFWFRGRQVILKKILSQFFQEKRDNSLFILDAGSGTGGNISWLKHFGYAIGIDFNDVACNLAAQKEPDRIIRADITYSIPFKPESFDLITLLDVLEHLDDDLGTLCRLRDKLKPGGKMLITVPAYSHLWSSHDIVHHHKRRYLRGQLRDLFTESKLEIDYLSYYNTLLYPVIALKRLLSKNMYSNCSGDMALPSNLLNTLLRHIFSFEKFWIGKIGMPIGVSIVAIVHRKAERQ